MHLISTKGIHCNFPNTFKNIFIIVPTMINRPDFWWHIYIYVLSSKIITLQVSVMITKVTMRSHNILIFLNVQKRKTYLSITWTNNMRTLINAWKSQLLFYPLIIRNGKQRYLVRGEEKEKKRTTENATTKTQHKKEIRFATLPSKNSCCALVITVSVTVYPHFQSHNAVAVVIATVAAATVSGSWKKSPKPFVFDF